MLGSFAPCSPQVAFPFSMSYTPLYLVSRLELSCKGVNNIGHWQMEPAVEFWCAGEALNAICPAQSREARILQRRKAHFWLWLAAVLSVWPFHSSNTVPLYSSWNEYGKISQSYWHIASSFVRTHYGALHDDVCWLIKCWNDLWKTKFPPRGSKTFVWLPDKSQQTYKKTFDGFPLLLMGLFTVLSILPQ